MSSIEISFIIPTFNSEKTIKNVLSSVIESNITVTYEILIIDDGSTDNTIGIATKYVKDINVDLRILTIGYNSGVSIARNLGIEKANGKYICFIDSDDQFSDLIQLSSMDYYNYEIIFWGWNYETGNKILYFNQRYTYSEKLVKGETLLIRRFENLEFYPIGGSLIKKSFLNENRIRFEKSIVIGEDLLFYVECLLNDPKIYIINKELIRIIKNSSSITNSIISEKDYTVFSAITKIKEIITIRPNKNTKELLSSLCNYEAKTIISLIRKTIKSKNLLNNLEQYNNHKKRLLFILKEFKRNKVSVSFSNSLQLTVIRRFYFAYYIAFKAYTILQKN
jgi:glycosyltransferase involved in cell wall biosynthesis